MIKLHLTLNKKVRKTWSCTFYSHLVKITSGIRVPGVLIFRDSLPNPNIGEPRQQRVCATHFVILHLLFSGQKLVRNCSRGSVFDKFLKDEEMKLKQNSLFSKNKRHFFSCLFRHLLFEVRPTPLAFCVSEAGSSLSEEVSHSFFAISVKNY